MFVDEPGLQFLFSAMSGYGDLKARGDLDLFFSHVDRPRGIHLCGNPDWDFLLNLDLDVLSLDVYTNAEIFSPYASSIKKFIERDGVIVWGIVPTGFETFQNEDMPSMMKRLETCLANPVGKRNRKRTSHRQEYDFTGNVLSGQSGQGTYG